MTEPIIRFSGDDQNRCQVISQGITPENFDDTKLPTDLHIIEYKVGDETFFDAIRAEGMVHIFDMYYDKLKDIGSIQAIRSGYGKILPKLYGLKPPQQKDDDGFKGSKGLFA